MRSPRRPKHTAPMIEPLESRIAPASLNLIAYNYLDSASNAKTGQTLQFINAGASLTGANAAIAEAVGDSPSVYFIKVSAGESVAVYNTEIGTTDLISVTQGTVVAFFTNSNSVAPNNNDPAGTYAPTVVGTDLTGLAVGNKVSAIINGGIYQQGGLGGDIVTNYNDSTGELGGTVAQPGHSATTEPVGTAENLLPNVITSLAIAGPVQGDLVAGAKVNFFQATGAVNDIITGTAANTAGPLATPYTYGFEGVANTTGHTTLSVPTPAPGVAGPSVGDAIVDSANGITLGAGGPGAAGGSLLGLTLLNQNSPITVVAGAGGAGISGRAVGGPGGTISNVVVNGPLAGATNLGADILLSFTGGAGGNGFAAARGGAGGAVANFYVGYNHTTSVFEPTGTYASDELVVQGGAGGSGGIAGVGGSLSNFNILVSTDHQTTGTLPSVNGLPGAELNFAGGAGGSTTVGGRGGAGGSISDFNFTNYALPPIDSTTGLPNDTNPNTPTLTQVVIEGGAGGTAAVAGPGGAGGTVSGLTLEGYNFNIVGGTGGNGISGGGAGGAISTLTVLGSAGALPGDNFHAESLYILTGSGGNGSKGPGGAGGALKTVTVQNGDFGATSLLGTTGFQIGTGAGGNAGKGAAGAGGSITGIQVTEIDFLTDSHPTGTDGKISITTGNGGSAPVAGGTGGAGGSIKTVIFAGNKVAGSTVTAGTGGTGGATGLAGRGGAGGSITGVAINNSEQISPKGLVGLFGNQIATPSVTTASEGILEDLAANFGVTGDDIQTGDTVANTTNGQTTTVLEILDNTDLLLASDIFAAGDAYAITPSTTVTTDLGAAGSAGDTQDTIIDTSVNFKTEGVAIGDFVEDITNFNLDATTGATEPFTATVLGVTPHQLEVSADISHVGDQYAVILTPNVSAASLTAGSGGAGFLTGAGGAGGSVIDTSANVAGPIAITGGAGGNGGASAAAGAGGSLNLDGAISTTGSATFIAGSAGQAGLKAGAGGSIANANIQVPLNIELMAGNGFNGGAGGSVTACGYSGGQAANELNLAPPNGNIIVQAGAGGSSAIPGGTGVGGAGGSIANIKGFVSGGDGSDPYITSFEAGPGGNGVSKAGAGGSVSSLDFFGGGGAGVTFTINAGDAGNAMTAKIGATGGSVTGVGAGVEASSSTVINSAFQLATATNFHHVSAGNGGDAVSKGGLGGSVTDVFVNGAIGYRTGVTFGFDSNGAGGISVGAGGTGVVAGLAGNVTDITADAIASIVAGHLGASGATTGSGGTFSGDALEAGNLANKVNGIILNGTDYPSTVQQFTLSIGAGINAETTVSLPTNASALEVGNALNALSNIQIAGGVGVSLTANGYLITFNSPGGGFGSSNAITGQEVSPQFTTEETRGNVSTSTAEVQQVQVLPNNSIEFTFEGDTTAALNAGATPTQVQTALNALPTINSAGKVTVTAGATSPNPSYVITFDNAGPEPLVAFTVPVPVSAATGTANSPNTQTVTLPTRTDILPSQLSTANLVGSIVNPLQNNSTTFNYTNSSSPFQFGDAPIDGLIAAVNLTAYKNFIPEAYVTEANGAAVLIDNTIS